MNYLSVFILFCNLYFTNGWNDTTVRKFNKNFMFGVGTSAYQVEGAWDEDGKGPSIWDTLVHEQPESVKGGYNGDVAADSYHLYKRDVEMARELGLDFYRFSISWSRILPTGFLNKINQKGIDYYNNLINELLKYNIKPMITLYHFDLPQNLQNLGGWTNPYIVTWFEDYSRLVFDNFGDRVEYWITINQPNDVCVNGYGDTVMPPAINSKGIGDYICIKNILMAHAKVYRLYQEEYKLKYKGSVGLTLALNWIDPLNHTSAEDKEAAEIARDFHLNLYMHPIWSEAGDFPSRVKEIIAKKSKQQGFSKSRLPTLSAEEIKLLRGSSDFVGMNHYTTSLATHLPISTQEISFSSDLSIKLSKGEKWTRSKSSWLRSVPYGIYRCLIYLNLQYNYPKFLITEHGWSTSEALFDVTRVRVLREYLSALLLAVEDGADVVGYTAWSLMDNVEWTAGISERFGLYHVDFESENKTRTARQSALVYKRIIKTRIVEDDYNPESLDISITPANVKTEL